jgi:hypothetical protein
MSKRIVHFLAMMVLSVAVCPALAQTAGMLSFQGLLKDPNGNPVNGPVTLQFRIYDARTGGNLVDMDGNGALDPNVGKDVKEVSTTAAAGIVSTKFGPVSPRAFDGNPRWLEVRVNGAGLSRTEIAGASAAAEQLNRAASGLAALSVDAIGRIGVGTQSPSQQFHIKALGAGTPDALLSFTSYQNKNWSIGVDDSQNGDFKMVAGSSGDPLSQNEFVTVTPAGEVGIGVQPVSRLTIYADDTAEVTFVGPSDGNIQHQNPSKHIFIHNPLTVLGPGTVSVLNITGGADLAEPFGVANSKDENHKIEPGMVVVIDPDNPGQLKLATEPYDRKVAGIISGANGLKPGMVMKSEGDKHTDGEHPVALTGRVYVWADASYGQIVAGDMLTTSATPGHAMKATDREKSFGAVIGKAMSRLEKGRGLVLVLVTLQ